MRTIFIALAMTATLVSTAQELEIFSPDKNIRVAFHLSDDGALRYQLSYKGRVVVEPSSLGMRFNEPDVTLQRFTLVSTDYLKQDTTWHPAWGEYAAIRDHHNKIVLHLEDLTGSGIKLKIIFKVFNEGVGFRYEFPDQPALDHFIVEEELTAFDLTGNHKVFWIPGDYDTNEYFYNTTKLSDVDASSGEMSQEIHAKTFFDAHAVQTPLMLKSDDGLYINIHEAALRNYPAMNLMVDKNSFALTSHLVPDAVGNKAYLQTPAVTPWRTVIVTDKAVEIYPSNRMILNLNEPSVIENTSWIKPTKYIGIWWEMHVGRSSWDYSGSQVGSQQQSRVPHGANTANMKKYLDFAAKHGFDAVLVEGWNTGWEDWFGKWKENVFDFVTPYPDYDYAELARYAERKGVEIITHNETSGSVTNFERQIDTSFRMMKNYGIDAVKTGYVGRIIPRGEHHDGQWMVRHYEHVAKKAARYKIMINPHEQVRPTGLHRTYPNWLSAEAARGNEFNAWSVGNPPEHETILPFTRLMGGPMDYTPGIFQIKMNYYDSAKKEQVHTTLAKQLALYVTMYSPLQMAADLPENYDRYLDAFQFIKDVPVDWDDLRVIAAEPGDYLVMARKEKGKENWFIGAITDEEARSFYVPLGFLPAGKKYTAIIYRDGDDAHWQKNPQSYKIEKKTVTGKTTLKLDLKEGGGAAVSLIAE